MKFVNLTIVALMIAASSLSLSATPEQHCIDQAYGKRDSAVVKAENVHLQDMMQCYQLADEGHYTVMAACQRAAREKLSESKGMAEQALKLDLAACSQVIAL
jgi:hypothetical protein